MISRITHWVTSYSMLCSCLKPVRWLPISFWIRSNSTTWWYNCRWCSLSNALIVLQWWAHRNGAWTWNVNNIWVEIWQFLWWVLTCIFNSRSEMILMAALLSTIDPLVGHEMTLVPLSQLSFPAATFDQGQNFVGKWFVPHWKFELRLLRHV